MRTLLVGINEYKLPGNDLGGCVNDVEAMQKSLVDYEENQIHVLLNKEATAANIREQLKWLVAETWVHTNLLFYYSGHGSYTRNYYTDNLESDERDEVICPHDFGWDVPESVILDDDIHEILKNKNPEAKLVCIFDCCHSGTMYRDFGNPDIETRVKSFSNPYSRNIHTKNAIDKVDFLDIPNTIFISGCQDDQVSNEFCFKSGNKKVWRGVLSYYLQLGLAFHANNSVEELRKFVISAIKDKGFEQEPNFVYGPNTDTSKFI